MFTTQAIEQQLSAKNPYSKGHYFKSPQISYSYTLLLQKPYAIKHKFNDIFSNSRNIHYKSS